MKFDIKYRLRIAWYYIEVKYHRIRRYFGKYQDESVIPPGLYCYVIDEERMKNEPQDNEFSGYWIKPCKYYRSMKDQMYGGCTYLGFIGWDALLGDQCKMCSENLGLDDEDDE